LLLRAVVHPANLADRAGGRTVLECLPAELPTLQRVWVDMGDQGRLLDWAQ
jgi:putative transposase